MKYMTVEEINNNTRSRGVTTPNCVYEAIEHTIAIDDMDNDPSTPGAYLVFVNKGDKFIILGCGDKHIQKDRDNKPLPSDKCTSAINIEGELMWIPNVNIQHYANPILTDIRQLQNKLT